MAAPKNPFNFDKKPPAEKLIAPEIVEPRKVAEDTKHFLGLQTCHSPTIALAIPAGYDLSNQAFYWYETSIPAEGKTFPVFHGNIRGVSLVCSSPHTCEEVIKRIVESAALTTPEELSDMVESISMPYAGDWYNGMVHIKRDGEPDVIFAFFDHESLEAPMVFVLRTGEFGGGGMIGSLKSEMQSLLSKCPTGKEAVILSAASYPLEDIVVYSVTNDNKVEKLFLAASEVQKEGDKITQLIALINAPTTGTVN